jgi:hypothetical protein
LLNDFSNQKGTIAFLCKTIVVKNIMKNLKDYQFSISNIRIYTIDSKKIFNISVDSCLFVADFGENTELYAEVFNFNSPNVIEKRIGWVNDSFVSDIDKYNEFSNYDTKCEFIWRQGIKHDSSKVMELSIKEKNIFNGFSEKLDVESEYIYGLLKSSDLKTIENKLPRKMAIVTQKSIGQDTEVIKKEAPKLWEYLERYSEYLDNRKSSVYNGKPRFSIFGVGDYSFELYKIGISGMYKNPNFCLIFPYENKPVMLDDTCYFISFNNFKDAFFTLILLNHTSTQNFIKSIAFLDSKRPYTKEILMRISLKEISKNISFDEIISLSKAMEISVTEDIKSEDYENYSYALDK